MAGFDGYGEELVQAGKWIQLGLPLPPPPEPRKTLIVKLMRVPVVAGVLRRAIIRGRSR